MRLKWKVLVGIALALLCWGAGVVWDYMDRGSVAHLSMQYQLKMFGSAMYEYHSTTGKWPSRLDDLAQTSLPRQSYVWKQSAVTMTFLWPQNLIPEPKDNRGVLLAYHHVGLFNKLGRVWVCWGDLRTQQLAEGELRAQLAHLTASQARNSPSGSTSSQ